MQVRICRGSKIGEKLPRVVHQSGLHLVDHDGHGGVLAQHRHDSLLTLGLLYYVSNLWYSQSIR